MLLTLTACLCVLCDRPIVFCSSAKFTCVGYRPIEVVMYACKSISSSIQNYFCQFFDSGALHYFVSWATVDEK